MLISLNRVVVMAQGNHVTHNSDGFDHGVYEQFDSELEGIVEAQGNHVTHSNDSFDHGVYEQFDSELEEIVESD